MRRLSTIIVDSDAGSRDHLRELCKSRSELELVAECGDPEEARNVILARLPDLAFLSARISGGMSGFQLARELPQGVAPLLVFVSAHDQHALQAFELGAVDYILQPVSHARFCETVQRAVARARACLPDSKGDARQLRDGAIANIADRAPRVDGCHRFILEIGDRVHLVDIGDIETIEADRNYVWINTAETYRVRASLKELQELLPADSFFRVNRSVIVNSRCITSIERRAHGEYAIHMCSGGVVTTGRRFKGHIPGIILRRQA
jgi:two-component system LytT family response regulator